jgi:trehalose 6-phosphate synthase
MILVSHRGPYSFERDDHDTFVPRRGAGGIVSALLPLLSGRPDVRWIAAAMSDDDRAAVKAGVIEGTEIALTLVPLDPELHRLHYDVVSNSVLWFLHHGLFDRAREPRFDRDFRDAWNAFVAVNEEFAAIIADQASAGEVVLVQDYQLSLVPAMVRSRRNDLRVVHFTHTPFGTPDDIALLPDDIGTQLCRSIASGPAGFHTERWASTFRASLRLTADGFSGDPRTFVAPLGPDASALEQIATSAAVKDARRSLDEVVGDQLVILRNDRIEPSKNIVRGFLAYDRLLEARPGLRGRVVFVAMVYPSRQRLDAYRSYARDVDDIAARVNERWSTRDWTPIVLDDRDDFSRSVAGMLRYDVLLVNPLRDGLNLVAKEGPACNRRDGVLCLSPEAGAFVELEPAVIATHPYDIEQAAGALDEALSMPLDERSQRANRLRALATARTPGMWLDDLVRHAGE